MHHSTLTLLAALGATRGVLAAPVAPNATAAVSNCTRAFLQAATETYMAAQIAGKPQTLLALAGSGNSTTVAYTEDAVARDLAGGVLTTPLVLAHNFSLLDTTQCATFTELIVTDPAHPRVIGTQMRFSADKKLVKVETLVTEQGDWAFNATGTLRYAEAETRAGKWAPILPVSARDSRATIQAAADAYMDLFNNKSVVVPWGTPCDRLEGSMYTGNGSATDSCDVGVPSGIHLTHRRYVVDETVGGVDALVTFETRPDSHMFRVAGGVLRQVHTLTVMRNVTGLPPAQWPTTPSGPATKSARRASKKLW